MRPRRIGAGVRSAKWLASPEELQPAIRCLQAAWDVMREFSTMVKLFSYSGQQLSEKEIKARLQSAMVLNAPISIRF